MAYSKEVIEDSLIRDCLQRCGQDAGNSARDSEAL